MMQHWHRILEEKMEEEKKAEKKAEKKVKKGSITNFVGFPIPLVALSAHIE